MSLSRLASGTKMHRNKYILFYSLLIIMSSGFTAAMSEDMIGSGEESLTPVLPCISSSSLLLPLECSDSSSPTLSSFTSSSPLVMSTLPSQSDLIPSTSLISVSSSFSLPSTPSFFSIPSPSTTTTTPLSSTEDEPSTTPLSSTSTSSSSRRQPTTSTTSAPLISSPSFLSISSSSSIPLPSTTTTTPPSPTESSSLSSSSTSTTPVSIYTNTLSTTTVSTTSTTSPTGSGGSSTLEDIENFFSSATGLVLAIGGPLIFILVIGILIFCCYCCCKRKKSRYSVEEQYNDHTLSNGGVVGSHYKRNLSIGNPMPMYQRTLRKVQEDRKRMENFVETEMGGENNADDSLHYQGHSQVQHSQPYSPASDIVPTQSLSRLTPFNASQLMSQVRGGISVDDIEEELPEKDSQRKCSRDNGGADSPFMHLSDNLAGSRGRISQRSTSDPHTELVGVMTQQSQVSQYSNLGLGVLHGGDVVFTNTASLADDLTGSMGMVGIDPSIKLSKESDLHSHRTASPLLNITDEIPVREESSNLEGGKLRRLSKLTSLTSLHSNNEPTKIPLSSTPTDEPIVSRPLGTTKRLDLSSITSLNRTVEAEEGRLTQSVQEEPSKVQEIPERQRRYTVETSRLQRAPGKSNQSRLGKLTSLEYIRASLRKKLNRMKRPDDRDAIKKPLKSALRNSRNTNSQNSSPDSVGSGRNSNLVYGNRQAMSLHNNYDESPSPFHQLPSPVHHMMPPQDFYVRSPNPADYPMLPPEGYGPGIPGMYPPGLGYPRGDPYMVALSPPGYAPEPLSPILSVSQFDHPGMYPAHHEIGILPQYGIPPPMMGGGYQGDQFFPPQPPHYDDDDDDDDDMPDLDSPYRNADQGGSASQRNVTWNLKPEEIPIDPENLTPSDIEEDMR